MPVHGQEGAAAQAPHGEQAQRRGVRLWGAQTLLKGRHFSSYPLFYSISKKLCPIFKVPSVREVVTHIFQ